MIVSLKGRRTLEIRGVVSLCEITGNIFGRKVGEDGPCD